MTKKIEHIVDNNIEKKRCGKCKKYSILDNFNKSSNKWDKLRPTCKTCLKKIRIANKSKKTEYNKKYWKKTKDKQSIQHKIWRKNNIEHVKKKNKEWRIKNGTLYDKKVYQQRLKKFKENPELEIQYKKRYRLYRRKYDKKRRQNDINYKVHSNISRRIREILHNGGPKKEWSTKKYTGCSYIKLVNHLEKKFKEGMNWKNYGRRWEIDHIIPVSCFDVNNELEKRAFSYYLNLQPLWSLENRLKSNKYNEKDKQKYLEKFIFYSIP